MIQNFYTLPIEKQEKIINAGFHVFANNSYKKSPMVEIAEYASISKSLLFYYFKNKKDLYFFLLERSGEITKEFLDKYGCYEKDDLFEIMYTGLQAKVNLMKQYPDMSKFVIKAYYEKEPSIVEDITKFIKKNISYKTNVSMLKFNKDDFIEGIDLEMMYKEMYLASVGYLWEAEQKGEYDIDVFEKGFRKLIDYWKNLYLKKEKK